MEQLEAILREIVEAVINDLPEFPKKLIVNDPAVILYTYPKGKRYVAKAQQGDVFDPELGVLVCCLKMLTKNKVRIDDFEAVLRKVSEWHEVSEYRDLANVIEAVSGKGWSTSGIVVEAMFDEDWVSPKWNRLLADVLRAAADAWELNDE